MNLLPRLSTTNGAAPREEGRLVLDVEYPLDDVVAALVRAELIAGRRVHVVVLLPGPVWSTDAALVASRRRRLDQALDQRTRELAEVAGDRAAQVTVSIQRRRRWPWPRHHPTHHPTASPTHQGATA